MKFAFVAKHRGIWPVRWMCEALGVSRSGFHAWLTRSPSKRARADEETGARVRASFLASDRTYGARRVWRDVLAEGICMRAAQDRTPDAGSGFAGSSSPARAAEGRRRSAVGRPVAEPSRSPVRGGAAEPEVDRRLHLCLDGRGLALRGGRHRPLLAPRRRLVDERRHDGAARHRCARHGDLATRQAGRPAAPLRSGQPRRI